MINQLLPCPFCGHDEPTHDEGDESAWVQCTNGECGMCGPMASGPSLAAAAWNRRATQPAAGDPVYQLRNTVVGNVWRDADKEAYDSAAKLAEYERRILWTAPTAAAHGDDAVPNLVPGLQWAIDYCDAMLRQGNDRMLVEVIRKRLENVRDNQPAAMRAQAGEGGEV